MRIITLLFCMALVAPTVRVTPMPTHHEQPSDRLPTLTSISTSLHSAWQWVQDVWHGLLDKLGLGHTPPLITQMYQTRVAREREHTQKYQAQGIPDELAAIAGVLDRMEQDFSALKKAIATESDERVERAFEREIDRIDDHVDTYMQSVQHIIDAHEKKAFTKKKTKLFQFIQVLQSRSFLNQLLES